MFLGRVRPDSFLGLPHREGQRVRMKPWTDPHLQELLALSGLAAFGCGLALAQGHFLFVGIFAAANAVMIIEAIRGSR